MTQLYERRHWQRRARLWRVTIQEKLNNTGLVLLFTFEHLDIWYVGSTDIFIHLHEPFVSFFTASPAWITLQILDILAISFAIYPGDCSHSLSQVLHFSGWWLQCLHVEGPTYHFTSPKRIEFKLPCNMRMGPHINFHLSSLSLSIAYFKVAFLEWTQVCPLSNPQSQKFVQCGFCKLYHCLST